MGASTSLVVSYDYGLVTLSILIAVLAACAALELAGEMRNALGRIRYSWLLGGAFAMGSGIWGMHYLGMEAFLLPIPIEYDWPTVLASLAAAILGSGAGLYVLSCQTLRLWKAALGSVFMGTGIALMHYIGMEAMRLRAVYSYSAWIVALSVLIAITLSFAAIRIAFHFKAQFGVLSWPKIGCALLLGLAISAMHYTGMAAVTFYPRTVLNGSAQNAVSVSMLSLGGIMTITILILAIVFLSAMVDRRFALRAIELADSRLQTQLIFDNLKEGIVVIDRDRNIVKINRAASDLLGIPETTRLLGETAKVFEVFLPTGELLPPAAWPSALAFRGEFLQSCELKLRRKDTGRTIIVEVSTAPIVNTAGETTQVIFSYRDITQPKKIDEARLRLAEIVESSEDAIIGKDDKGIITSWNLGAEKVFGYSSEEMIGKSIKGLVPDDRAHEEEEILARIGRGEIVDHIETVRKKKNGQFINVSLTISPIYDATGKIIGASKIARNITDRKRLESQLLQSQKMDAVGQLTGGIAHDFNNLLGVVMGNLDLLERQLQDNPTALKRLHTAQKASLRGAELTRRLLAFSSSEELHPAAADLNASIQNTIELAARALGPEIRITLQLEPSIPPVFADIAGLESAILNLLVNARDAMPRGGAITITSDVKYLEDVLATDHQGGLKHGKYAYVSVSDTGSGMSREVMAKAFEPFYTTKPRGKGTGLGLAMVYGFFKQSGGAVRLYSEVGYGTTVSFYLPLAEAVEAMPNQGLQGPLVRGQGSILIVDDEADLLEVAISYVRDMGFIALEAKDGPSALEVIRKRADVGLLITDIIMPGGMSGVELAVAAREINPVMKVIYCSGFPAGALAERSMPLVDGPFLRKPYQRSDFNAIVQDVMYGGDLNRH